MASDAMAADQRGRDRVQRGQGWATLRGCVGVAQRRRCTPGGTNGRVGCLEALCSCLLVLSGPEGVVPCAAHVLDCALARSALLRYVVASRPMTNELSMGIALSLSLHKITSTCAGVSLTLHAFSLSHMGRFRAPPVAPSKKLRHACMHACAAVPAPFVRMQLPQRFPGYQHDVECADCSSVVLSKGE